MIINNTTTFITTDIKKTDNYSFAEHSIQQQQQQTLIPNLWGQLRILNRLVRICHKKEKEN